MFIVVLFTIARTWKQPRWPLTNEWIKNLWHIYMCVCVCVCVCIDNGILPSHKRNTFKSVLIRLMNLEPIIQSEVSQKEKNKYHILNIYMESRKMVLIKLFTGQQWKHRHREQTCTHTFNSLNKMDHFLKKHKIPKIN